jgi:DNA mismatch repair endonuclease MutH
MRPEIRSEAELLSYAKRLERMRISEISELVGGLDVNERRLTKSVVANIIETNYFGIPTNSEEYPDFKDLGIELKVSPLKPVYGGKYLNAKERNVIGMVDYSDVLAKPSWHDNNRLSKKLRRVLFVFYVHDDSVPAMAWKVVTTFLWSPNRSEDQAIQRDYEIIRARVLSGQRNREGDNTFLATCPKHAGGFNRSDPTSSAPGSLSSHPSLSFAEKRGFCLRNKEVTRIIAEANGIQPVFRGRSVLIPASFFEQELRSESIGNASRM